MALFVHKYSLNNILDIEFTGSVFGIPKLCHFDDSTIRLSVLALVSSYIFILISFILLIRDPETAQIAYFQGQISQLCLRIFYIYQNKHTCA